MSVNGFLNILKPPAMSSHAVVNVVRHLLHEKKVGHAGTLDPGATGVLPVAVGKATRLLEYLEKADKFYRAEVKFGVSTDSGDDLGNVVDICDNWHMPEVDAIEQALAKFRGHIRQVPPAFAAVRINGRHAYELARRGQEVEMPSREVTINTLELILRRIDSMVLDIECSKGTYIRSLCMVLGKELGIAAMMSFLLRMRVGAFTLSDTITLEELEERGEAALLTPDLLLKHLPRYDLTPARRNAFCCGLPTTDKAYSPVNKAENLRVYAGAEFLGIGHYDAKQRSIVPQKVLAD